MDRAMAHEDNLVILAKRYRDDPIKFCKYALRNVQPGAILAGGRGEATDPTTGVPTGGVALVRADDDVDVVVVGAGLAGLSATLALADRGARVMLVDKNKFTGGNSAYASSGVNAVMPPLASGPSAAPGSASSSEDEIDSVALYMNDTLRSSGRDLYVLSLHAVSWESAQCLNVTGLGRWRQHPRRCRALTQRQSYKTAGNSCPIAGRKMLPPD